MLELLEVPDDLAFARFALELPRFLEPDLEGPELERPELEGEELGEEAEFAALFFVDLPFDAEALAMCTPSITHNLLEMVYHLSAHFGKGRS